MFITATVSVIWLLLMGALFFLKFMWSIKHDISKSIYNVIKIFSYPFRI